MSIAPEILAAILICIAMASISQRFGIMNTKGNILAFVQGIIIGLASLTWLILLLLFLVTSVLVTRYGFDRKEKMGLQEGIKGERGWRNVAANGAIPTAIALIALLQPGLLTKEMYSVLFITAVAVAASDTSASELGMLNPKAYLITTLKPVKAGVDGGISTTGELWAFLAALYTAVMGALALYFLEDINLSIPQVIIPAISGFAGCQIDSLIGATLERKGTVGKLGNNMVSIALGTLLSLLILTVLF